MGFGDTHTAHTLANYSGHTQTMCFGIGAEHLKGFVVEVRVNSCVM
jgi:hypothetical protein